tara:strand:+ start:29 stop:526 length:498 start_codon:yes stop_codon:yes gene_type:complete
MNFIIESVPYILVLLLINVVVFMVLKRTYRGQNQPIYSDKELELKLRAYERMIFLVERIEPVGMINRLKLHDMSIELVKSNLINNIVIEYEYNVSQQIYISHELWDIIVLVKDKTINHISSICDNLNTDVTIEIFLAELIKNQTLDKVYKMAKYKIKLEVKSMNP